MKKYLYLAKKEWVQPWTKGGVVPLYQASKYLSDVREGVMTPDENLIDTSTHDIKQHGDVFKFVGGGTVILKDSFVNGIYHPSMVLEQKTEDGLVLCLSNSKNSEVAARLIKTSCVEIRDVEFLKRHLDKQIGIISIMKTCEYTGGHNRNHFLKSSLDAWQDEYRIFWPGAKSIRVSIPSGIATEVNLKFI